MASASHSLLAAGSCVFRSHRAFRTAPSPYLRPPAGTVHHPLVVRASSEVSEDCNTEECAPEKEVGKVSMEWVAGDKTRVVGTYPPTKKGWTGYVEKDTAGQTNIYAVEPVVYVAESALSSGNSGTSSEGTENTVAVVVAVALVSVAAASLILTQVGKNPPQAEKLDYTGPSLSYYINKFKPPEIVEALAPPDQSLAPSTDAPSLESLAPSTDSPSKMESLAPSTDSPSLESLPPSTDSPSKIEALASSTDSPSLESLAPSTDSPSKTEVLASSTDSPSLESLAPSTDSPSLESLAPSTDSQSLAP